MVWPLTAASSRRQAGRCMAGGVRVHALALGHLVVDLDQGVLVVLVPALHDALGTSAGMGVLLVAAWMTASAIVQPLFGLAGDRRDAGWLVPVGVGTAG